VNRPYWDAQTRRDRFRRLALDLKQDEDSPAIDVERIERSLYPTQRIAILCRLIGSFSARNSCRKRSLIRHHPPPPNCPPMRRHHTHGNLSKPSSRPCRPRLEPAAPMSGQKHILHNVVDCVRVDPKPHDKPRDKSSVSTKQSLSRNANSRFQTLTNARSRRIPNRDSHHAITWPNCLGRFTISSPTSLGLDKTSQKMRRAPPSSPPTPSAKRRAGA
jgi:hypothetical protein